MADKPKVKGKSLMSKIADGAELVLDVFFKIFPVLFVIGAICAVIGLFYGLFHSDEARRMHAEHDLYVFNQEVCEVHHAWYVPSENIGALVACRRLSDHSLFLVQDTGREMVPNVD
jgi:hypothetical protein